MQKNVAANRQDYQPHKAPSLKPRELKFSHRATLTLTDFKIALILDN